MVQKENKLVYGESFTKEKFKNPSKEFGIDRKSTRLNSSH